MDCPPDSLKHKSELNRLHEDEMVKRRTDALNLWDIERRIRELQVELDEMHHQKESLLEERKSSFYPQNPPEYTTCS